MNVNFFNTSVDKDRKFIFDAVAVPVLINDTETRAAIVRNQGVDRIQSNADRVFVTREVLRTGDYVTYDGETYLIGDDVGRDSGYYKGRGIKCEYTVKIFTDVMRLYVGHTDIVRTGLNSDGGIMTVGDKATFTTSDTRVESTYLDIGLRLITMNRVWFVESVERTVKGLATLLLKQDLVNSGDDFVNRIAMQENYTKSKWVGIPNQ
jgi:hypothetical protein